MSDTTERDALEEVLTEILSEPLGDIVAAVDNGRYSEAGQYKSALLRMVIDFVIADRDVRLDSKRQEFLDRAAIAVRSGADMSGCTAYEAYDAAQELWAERENRRLAKPEEIK